MSKKIIAVTGLAAALSILSPGCSQQESLEAGNSAKQVQKANIRRGDHWEDASVSYIAKDRDFIKSVNLLLSLHNEVIPEVQKSYAKMGIEKALGDAFTRCRSKGLLRDNSKAYTFTNIILENYGTKGFNDQDFEAWSVKFRTAGQEAEALLREPEGIHRKFVPNSFNDAFLRPASLAGGQGWSTCDELERENSDRAHVRDWEALMRKDPRNR